MEHTCYKLQGAIMFLPDALQKKSKQIISNELYECMIFPLHGFILKYRDVRGYH